jgi:UDP-N-acetyl-D-mannosaminuronic acid transferase (WecB/TagA/CpsF family)
MESLNIPSASLDDVRLDFPSRSVLSSLPYLWDDERNHQICFISTSQWQRAKKRDEYGSMIASADLVLPRDRSLAERACAHGDQAVHSWPVPFLHQILLDALYESMEMEDGNTAFLEKGPGFYKPQKVLTLLLSAIERKNGSVFLLGGSPVTLVKAGKNIRATYSGITIVGSMHGMYLPQEETALIQAIQKGNPSLILAGDPIPSGERWISRHMSTTRSGIFFYYGPILSWFAGR